MVYQGSPSEIENPDGSLTVVLDDEPRPAPVGGKGHNDNLAEVLDESILCSIAGEVLEGVEDDIRSRQEMVVSRAKAIDILGIKMEMPRNDLGSSAAPLEGMSNIRHPLTLEAALRFQANARGELLPADGPIKVKYIGQGDILSDFIGEQLETSMNNYVTTVASEYYPDTDRMLFLDVGVCGAGFKKGYHCPLRSRPVIESVDGNDLIVNSSATDLQNATRVTHRIYMSRTVLKRMQIAEAYRDVELLTPTKDYDRADAKIKKVQGLDAMASRSEDVEHTIYECYCDLDIEGFEHKIDGKISGLPLPYKVSIDKTTRTVLEIRRNWLEDDKECRKRRNFVMYPFVPWSGFYPLGLFHILANTTNAVTAAWRVLLDAGMFGNFPGFLYLKNGVGQGDNNFRVAPGSGAPIDASGGDIRNAIMPLPYRTPDGTTMSLVDNVVQTGQRVGGTAEIPVGEGRQDAPVGTTLALIEQATKIMDAVHKRLHSAQSEEFQMLKELLKEDPEALWRHTKQPHPWNEMLLRAALENFDLVPVADPNTPSHMHRLMKAQGLKLLASANPQAYDLREVDTYCMQAMRISDPDRFFNKNPQAAQPQPQQVQQGQQSDPAALQLKAMTDQMNNRTRMAALQQKAQNDQITANLKRQDLMQRGQTDAQRHQLELAKLQQDSIHQQAQRQADLDLERMRIAERLATHPASAPLVTGHT